MKALILAAGLGTRLLPYTRHTPKPLFSLNGRPMLDLVMEQLLRAGCRAAIVNTHHHHQQIEAFITERRYPIPVITRHEPEILGTGGAIQNIADFWPAESLLVINADIVTDIDLRRVYQFHMAHAAPVTMVMHDYPQFNSVWVDAVDNVAGFDPNRSPGPDYRCLAFTGIHIIRRRVLDYLPPTGAAHIINAYTRMIASGETLKALVSRGHYWRDIGTPESYRTAVLDHMAPVAFAQAFGSAPGEEIHQETLKGDGSDRHWSRLRSGKATLIAVDHGIRVQKQGQQEVDAFVDIGSHLHATGVPVPRIYLHDRFSGMVFLEDLGDRHLQAAARDLPRSSQALYQQVIECWSHMAIKGAKGFDTRWTWQTAWYDRELILDRECRYFIEAFVNGYLGNALDYDEWAGEFEWLADQAVSHGVTGFIHRDLQSRNIMLHKDQIHFIDFQGGRMGPIQYDLAALLIDPYVALPRDLQEELCRYALTSIARHTPIDPDQFMLGYQYCMLTRNLQMLGAFGYLSRVKGKSYFESFIPPAVKTLQYNLAMQLTFLPGLNALVDEIAMGIDA